MNTAENTWAALNTGIPFTTEQMSQAIYDCLCEYHTHDYVYGEYQQHSLEITWHLHHKHWQLIHRHNGQPRINYDQLHAGSLIFEEPALLFDMCENLGIVDQLKQDLEDEL